LSRKLADLVGMFKINTHLFTAEGPVAVRGIAKLGRGIFLDLKYHDIPNTVSGAVAAAVRLPGVKLLNVHTLGGVEMMRSAAIAVKETKLGARRPKLLGVTILTSHDAASLESVGIRGTPASRAVKLARLAQKCGLDGVVASPHEVRAIRRACGKQFLIVVPGIRPTEIARLRPRKEDQARVSTPCAAIEAGADYLVIGRPITAADDPRAVAEAILAEIATALS
jgi:orotidine-5'-phosphate decarboxylase